MQSPQDDNDRNTIAGLDSSFEAGSAKLVAKRALDILGALIFFLLFGGIYLIVWWVVLITTGSPAIYRHKRIGRNGREFSCLKFRSMVVNSDEVLQDLLLNDPAALREWNTTFKLRNDPRITRFGSFIRKTSLDELPQFWNVLRGDMSIVGPRPVVRKELDVYYGAYASTYMKVRPGITGPWQVGGRSDLSYPERVALDSNYVRNWTVLGDIGLIFRTVGVVFHRRGSY